MSNSKTSTPEDSERDMMQWLIKTPLPVPPVPPEAKGKRWTEDEIVQLLAELRDPEHISVSDIASAHGRTCGAIEARMREIAADMVERSTDRAEVERSTRLTSGQIDDAVEKRLTQLTKQKNNKEKKEKEKEEKKQKEKADAQSMRAAMNAQVLSVEQQCALQQFDDDDNLFITGEGGTGKTLLIRHLVRSATSQGKKVQVCALTGCAAILLECNARTIHSWSGIRLGQGEVNDIVEGVFSNHIARTAWRSTDILIVDEVSMMSAHIFDILDTVGRRVRGSNKPFGGLQVVFVGDFFQLPPVAKRDDTSEGQFCFESDRWLNTFPIDNHIVLNTMFRQSDPTFRRILGHVRMDMVDEADINELKKCMNRPFDSVAHQGVVPAKLFPTRNKVDAVNDKMFKALKGTIHKFEVVQKTTCTTLLNMMGKPIPQSEIARCKKQLTPQKMAAEMERLMKNSPCGMEPLLLKVGANVMCTSNLSVETGICNGSLGVIVDFAGSDNGTDTKGLLKPMVRFSNGITLSIPLKFYQSEACPTLAVGQYPLMLAWAMTIHKIQGATLTMAEIDVGGGIFACGQTYVALSRVRDLDGLYLSQFDPCKIKTNARVRKFYTDIPEVEYEVEEVKVDELKVEEVLDFEQFAMV